MELGHITQAKDDKRTEVAGRKNTALLTFITSGETIPDRVYS